MLFMSSLGIIDLGVFYKYSYQNDKPN